MQLIRKALGWGWGAYGRFGHEALQKYKKQILALAHTQTPDTDVVRCCNESKHRRKCIENVSYNNRFVVSGQHCSYSTTNEPEVNLAKGKTCIMMCETS